jgi:isopentenyldiphosphate isomerase
MCVSKEQNKNKIELIDLKNILSRFESSGSSRSDILYWELCRVVEMKINTIIKIINDKKLWKQ